MPYPVELFANSSELYPILDKAAGELNALQNEFRFSTVPGYYRDLSFALDKTHYVTTEIFDWLRVYKKSPGHHPFLIMAINQPLDGEKFGNLFGSLAREDGLAVFTVKDFSHFIFDLLRFCKYYLIRYSLSFVAPDIVSHPSRNCMFDNKVNKRDILLSLNSGNICDDCKDKLQKNLNPNIHTAVSKMLMVLSLRHPFAAVMNGGGVKGLAHAGAMIELSKHFTFDTFAGTSAGGIAAILLAAGYSPDQLAEIFTSLDFVRFLHDPIWRMLINLFNRGLFSGNQLTEVLKGYIDSKYPQCLGNVHLEDLKHRAVVYAVAPGQGTIDFDGRGSRRETSAVYALRSTMSIPLVFTSPRFENSRLFDGGLQHNFPLARFLAQNPQQPVIALYLYSKNRGGSVFADLLEGITDNDERETVLRHQDKVVIIETDPIGTMKFNLSKEDKEFLLLSGRLGAIKYLKEYFPDLAISHPDVSIIENERKKALDKLTAPRK